MKVVVVGCGFVGNTVASSLEKNKSNYDIVRIDPALYETRLADNLDAAAYIVCVPTPSRPDGSCDTSIVDSVIDTIGDNGVILVRSTMPPEAIDKYPENVTYNPEFLREATAEQDFANQKVMVFGTDDGEEYKTLPFQAMFNYLDCEFVTVDRRTASMVKYTHNAWLATKVVFFHELYRTYGDKFNFDAMSDVLAKFENIGPSHMRVPYPENMGYGGHCFPKDMTAFLDFTGHELVEEVINLNEVFKNS